MKYNLIFLALLLTACGGGSRGGYYSDDGPPEMSAERAANVPDAVFKEEPLSATGNSPYRVYGVLYRPVKDLTSHVERGEASWYGKMFHGRRASSGEIYDMYAMTAAHKTLPLPSYVRVTNLENQKSVVVKVNDRGPFLHGRIIDVSYAAAAKLGMVRTGTANVEISLVTASDTARATAPVRDAVRPVQNNLVAAAQSGANLHPEVRVFELEDNVGREQEMGNIIFSSTLEPSPTSTPTPSSMSLTAGSEVWFQVGAYRSAVNAGITRDRLSEAGFATVDVYSSEGTGGAMLHRVRLGPFTEQEAMGARSRLEQVGYWVYRVVQ